MHGLYKGEVRGLLAQGQRASVARSAAIGSPVQADSHLLFSGRSVATGRGHKPLWEVPLPVAALSLRPA
ncbi:MAG TPA: hypothetical protein VGF67_15125 [Ktedonobacteraceae bacterium]